MLAVNLVHLVVLFVRLSTAERVLLMVPSVAARPVVVVAVSLAVEAVVVGFVVGVWHCYSSLTVRCLLVEVRLIS